MIRRPIHHHDCGHCSYLFTDYHLETDRFVDFYVHKGPNKAFSILARFSDDPSDYAVYDLSGLIRIAEDNRKGHAMSWFTSKAIVACLIISYCEKTGRDTREIHNSLIGSPCLKWTQKSFEQEVEDFHSSYPVYFPTRCFECEHRMSSLDVFAWAIYPQDKEPGGLPFCSEKCYQEFISKSNANGDWPIEEE